MKLIAKRSFRNPGRQIKLAAYDINEDHIPKGATFEIGGNKPYEGLNRGDQELVAQLNFADCIADANDPSVIKAVEKEMVHEAARIEMPERNLLRPGRHGKAAAPVSD